MKSGTHRWPRIKRQSKLFVSPEADEFGSVAWSVEPDTCFQASVDACLRISDCSKVAVLDFTFFKEKGRKARLKKLDLIIKSLHEMRDSLERTPIPEKKDTKTRRPPTMTLEELHAEHDL